MKKVYMDLAVVAVCVFIALKYTVFFTIGAAILCVVWLFVISDEKKTEIKNKISSLYNR